MKIIFNGKSVNTSVKYAHELGEGNIIVNGYEIHTPYILKEGDNVVIFKKGQVPKREQFTSMISARNNMDTKKLLNASVVICGLGGLGSNIAVMLGRAGVGHLCLIDYDIVDITNLNRQYYFTKHIGMLKTDAICEIISEINPYIETEKINIKIDEDNIKDLFEGISNHKSQIDGPPTGASHLVAPLKPNPKKSYDFLGALGQGVHCPPSVQWTDTPQAYGLGGQDGKPNGVQVICEAFDNPYAKALLVNYVLENHPHKKLVCGSGMAGLYSSNLIQTKRVMKNLYICGDETNEAKIGEGLTAPRVSICAGHEANMILRLINDMEEV
ncbi:MAG: ThiF family adenylyltransferase [Abditibacteriota bacterium]|nr:ThiF family adenylyltransferase [Abditibacteriota bacterium]